MTGIELIAIERKEQIEKHNRSIQWDEHVNPDGQLSRAASLLCAEDRHTMEPEEWLPEGWDMDIWVKMWNKPHKERLIIAGALIAAEIDRLNLAN